MRTPWGPTYDDTSKKANVSTYTTDDTRGVLHARAQRKTRRRQPYLPVEAVVALLEGEQEVDGAGQAGDLVFRHRPETAVIERAVITRQVIGMSR